MLHTYLNEGCCCSEDSEEIYEVGAACAPLGISDPDGATISVFRSIKLLLTDSARNKVQILILLIMNLGYLSRVNNINWCNIAFI